MATKKKATPRKKATPAKKNGRPSIFTPALAARICTRLAEGESLRSICAEPGMPHRNSVFNWLDADSNFLSQYVRAREQQADYYAEQVVEIADKVLPALKRTIKGAGKKKTVEITSGDAVERSRLMMDARKWYASKLAPKRYGDTLGLGKAAGLDALPMVVVKDMTGRKGAEAE